MKLTRTMAAQPARGLLDPAPHPFLITVLCAVSLGGLVSKSMAVEVEPARLEQTIPADEPAQGQLQITNRSNAAVGVQIGAGPYRFLQGRVTMPSAESWLSFEPPSFTLAAGATTSVRYTIRPPENIANDTAGEYVAAVLVDERPAEQPARVGPVEPQESRPSTSSGRAEGSSRVSIVPRLALPVYLQIQGRQLRQVKVSKLEVTGKTQGTASKGASELLWIQTTLHNAGTVHVRPGGSVAVFNQATSQLYRSAPLGKSLPILPSASLTYPVVMPLPDPGKYRVVVTVEPFQGGKLLQEESHFQVTKTGEVTQ